MTEISRRCCPVFFRILKIVFLLLISSGPVFCQVLSEGSLVKIKNATVFVSVKHQFVLTTEEMSTSGSGFFINEKGLIATNYHVIQSSLSDYKTLYPTKIKEIKIYRNSGTSEYIKYTAKIVSIDKENDLAILAVSDSAKYPFIDIDTSKLSELKPVWVFGYPFGEEFAVMQRGPEVTVSNGAISALRHDDLNELNRIQVDAVINHGNSGGPVVNEQGKVIGIINSMMGTSRINFAVPAHYLGKMIKNIPNDFLIGESTHLKIKTIPEDAEVFVDTDNVFVKDGVKDDYKPSGLHTLVVMRKGYESRMEELCFTGNYDKTITLLPEKNIVVPAMNSLDTGLGNKNPSVLAEGELLLKENFEDPEKFKLWEQNTGGEKIRTWFLENGTLNQFENNGTLHAIYLGEKDWVNYSIKARVRIIGDGAVQDIDSRAGIIFRETEDGFYLFRIHKESNKAQLAYHSKNPFGWFILAEKKLEGIVDAGKWYDLSATVNGNAITCALDKKNIFNVNASYSPMGRVGFYSVESKPMFDSLVVTKIENVLLPAALRNPSLVSFWFSDNFNLKSNWWYQYKINGDETKKEEVFPLYMVDGSFAVAEEVGLPRSMELTKFKLQDFSLNLFVSVDKGKSNALFEIFIRKEGQSQIVLRFEKEENKLSIVSYENGKEKILKEKKNIQNIFGNTSSILVRADENSISVGNMYSEWLSYKSKNIPLNAGRIGFSSGNVRLAFHQLTISSIPRIEGKK